MIRRLLLTVAILIGVASGTAHAYGKWELVGEGTYNYWDFSVGKGQFCWVDYAGQPYYYSGSTGCATGRPQGGVVDRSSDFSRGNTFPNGHAQRIAVAEPGSSTRPWLYVTTAEGSLWVYGRDNNSKTKTPRWTRWNQLPSALPLGMNGSGVSRLAYEAINIYTGIPAANPLWMLGSDGHVYHLIGAGSTATWQDASVAYGLGSVVQVSYSAMFEAIIVTWSDGAMAFYNDQDDQFFNVAPAATNPVATDPNYSFHFGAGYYGAGGLYQAWCGSLAADQTCQYTFNLGNFGWYDLDSLPAIDGYPQIFSDEINEAYPDTANASIPDQEVPINIAEGSFTQYSSGYGGGPADTAADYSDLIWVQTNKLRVYVYEIWLFENR